MNIRAGLSQLVVPRRSARKNDPGCAAKAGGLPVLDVAAAFEATPPEERMQWFLDHMHLNAAGNRILAEAMQRELEQANLLPPRN